MNIFPPLPVTSLKHQAYAVGRCILLISSANNSAWLETLLKAFGATAVWKLWDVLVRVQNTNQGEK